jgi:hypothetical protein
MRIQSEWLAWYGALKVFGNHASISWQNAFKILNYRYKRRVILLLTAIASTLPAPFQSLLPTQTALAPAICAN